MTDATDELFLTSHLIWLGKNSHISHIKYTHTLFDTQNTFYKVKA